MTERFIDRPFEALVAELHDRFAQDNRADFERANLIDLLDILRRHIGLAMVEPLGVLDDGTPYEGEHNASAMIGQLVAALKDLDRGKRDPLFQPSKTAPRGFKCWRQRTLEDQIRVAFQAVRDGGRFKTDKAAARELAKALAKYDHKIRGRRITAVQIINLKYR